MLEAEDRLDTVAGWGAAAVPSVTSFLLWAVGRLVDEPATLDDVGDLDEPLPGCGS